MAAIAIKQAVNPLYLLRPNQWQPQGWSVVRRAVRRQVLVDAHGQPLQPVGVDAFEWTDAQGFGIGGTDNGIARLDQELAKRGGTLYAYSLLRREVFNFLGVRSWSYRLVLLHNPAVIVPLLEFAVLVLAVAFGAIIFIQYVTTGHSPAVDDLKAMWTDGVKAAGEAVGEAGGGLAEPFVWLFLASGVAAIAFAQAGKAAGVKARQPALPKASVGVRTGAVSTRVSG